MRRMVDPTLLGLWLLTWQRNNRLCCQNCWNRMSCNLLCQLITYLPHDMLNKTHMVKWSVECSVSVHCASVEMLCLAPDLLYSNGKKVRSCCNIPQRVYVNFWTCHQVLNDMRSVNSGIIESHGKFHSIAYLDSYLL